MSINFFCYTISFLVYFYSSYFFIITELLCPPNPNELDIAYLISLFLPAFGTISKSHSFIRYFITNSWDVQNYPQLLLYKLLLLLLQPAPSKCPVFPLVELTITLLAASPKVVFIADVSKASFICVDVPCAFI